MPRSLIGRAGSIVGALALLALLFVQVPSATPDRALAWMLPWVQPGGWLLIPGAETPPSIAPSADVQEVEVREYRVPESGPRRTLWLGRSVS